MSSSGKSSAKANPSDGAASTSRSLLVRLREHDSTAWDRLVTLYAPLVYYWCRKLGLREQDIPDVVQEVFKSVTIGLERFRNDRPDDTFRGWLKTITRNKAIDHFRRQSKQPQAAGGSDAQRRLSDLADTHDLDAVDDVPDDGHVYHALFLRACDLIRTDFKKNTWQAFWRVVVEGQSPKEVAEELSVQPGTVRVAKSRVLQRLRQELGELPE